MKPTNTSYLDALDAIHPDLIMDYLETGVSSAIPEDVQLFIKQIQWASEIFETEKNTTRAAKKLKQRVFANQGVSLAVTTCKARVFQAMEFFDVDHNIPQEIWDRHCANRFEDLATLAISQDKLNEAGRFIDRANELRKRANSALNIGDMKMPQFLITTTISPEDLGYEKKNMLEISKKANEGFYLKYINELPISKQEKKRLLQDAEVEDVEFEELDDE